MSFLYDVAVPEMALTDLTYQCPIELQSGVRVIVEVQSHLHAGFVLGLSKKDLTDIKIKNIEGIIDDCRAIDSDLWDMSLYAGRVCLCGAGAALKVILPRPVIMGDKIFSAPAEPIHDPKNFREKDYFNPIDSERKNFYLDELTSDKRTLMLLPGKEAAKEFFESLPEDLKAQAVLWPSVGGKKLWLTWLMTRDRKFRIVIGSAGAVFAPLMPEKIIIEDEANPAYVIPPVLNISARSLAGRRAAFLGAEFVAGGRIPSLKTFIRSKPEQKVSPDKSDIIIADIFHSKTRNEEAHGVKGSIPLTLSLIKHTYRELAKGNSVMWIMDRLGEASEVFCDNCGEALTCPKCKNIMRVENDGKILKCRVCGSVSDLPERCPHCGGKFFTGNRPGLEALERIARKYYDKVHLYADKYFQPKKASLILSTQRGLRLCEKIKPSLVAWLDLNLELWRPGYDTRREVFSLLWESYWRGRGSDSGRKVIIQTRRSGLKLARFLYGGWEKFFPNELATRREYNLPPFSHMIELETEDNALRERLLDAFFEAGVFVMDPGDEAQPLYINTDALEPVEKVLSSFASKRKLIRASVV